MGTLIDFYYKFFQWKIIIGLKNIRKFGIKKKTQEIKQLSLILEFYSKVFGKNLVKKVGFNWGVKEIWPGLKKPIQNPIKPERLLLPLKKKRIPREYFFFEKQLDWCFPCLPKPFLKITGKKKHLPKKVFKKIVEG